jgi:hypothetical protein
MTDRKTEKEVESMKSKKVVVISFLIGSLLFPLSLGADVAGPPGTGDAIREEEVRQFIDKYVDRYKAMDIDLFMELFSRKGVENRMLPYADIRTTYHDVFAASNQFLYYLTIYSIQTRAQSAFVTGRYTLVQTLRRGNRMRMFHGNIQWDLVKEEGSLKIREINYGRSRGDD